MMRGLLPHLSSSHTSPHSLDLLCHSETDARFMQDSRKAVWSIPYVSVASFFPSLKHNFIAYRSSKVSSRPDCIFEIHQLWQSVFSRVYSNCCCSCSFEPEIIKIGQSSHKIYSNNILYFQECMTILNACTKKKRLETLTNWPRRRHKDTDTVMHIETDTDIDTHSDTDIYIDTNTHTYTYIQIVTDTLTQHPNTHIYTYKHTTVRAII